VDNTNGYQIVCNLMSKSTAMFYQLNKGIFISILLLLIFGCTESKKNTTNQILWYDEAATVWEEALPLGNGRLGVMVFGDPRRDRIQLNDDSLWPHDLQWEHPSGGPEELKSIRRILLQGDAKSADSLMIHYFSNKSITRSHQTLGDLYLNWEHHDISDYKRSLDLSTAISHTHYKVEGYKVEQKVFVSHPHQTMVISLSSEHPKGLNGNIRLDRPLDQGEKTVTVKSFDKQIIMQGEVTQRAGQFKSEPYPILSGVKFETRLSAEHTGGRITTIDDGLALVGLKKLTLFIASNSDYYTPQYAKKNDKELKKVLARSLKEVEQLHIKDHQSYFNRTQFKLKGNEALTLLTTDQRLERIKADSLDLGMSQLLFDYGRYLLIGSSRPGTQPANLQGLWNQHINAPWNADYHLNINLQMNYWLANLTGLNELNEPLFDYLDRLVESGKITAQKNFGMRGSVFPHATDLWVPSWLRAATAYWGVSFGAGGWMMQHYWYHYQFTKDEKFLRTRAYPAMEQVALFYSDWLVEDPRDQTLISIPSSSPENRYINEKGESVALCRGSAMDQQVIHEIFSNYLEACKILRIKSELTVKITDQLKKLRPGFVLGKDGRILEWDREYAEPEPGHRHMSHLYGFHPGDQVSKDKTPKLFQAVRKTLDYRLDNGGAGTGWSRAWLINCSARLMDGEMAYEHIQFLFQKSILKNLFDAHPPFQIDGNFGYTSGVIEMLLQSHEDHAIRLLPALPKVWKTGSIKGLTARGNITVDMEWGEGNLDMLTLTSKLDQSIRLLYKDQELVFKLKKGKPFIHDF
jgi:alpha-L-fucosidase 2